MLCRFIQTNKVSLQVFTKYNQYKTYNNLCKYVDIQVSIVREFSVIMEHIYGCQSCVSIRTYVCVQDRTSKHVYLS
jgi:hypothetical protein